MAQSAPLSARESAARDAAAVEPPADDAAAGSASRSSAVPGCLGRPVRVLVLGDPPPSRAALAERLATSPHAPFHVDARGLSDLGEVPETGWFDLGLVVQGDLGASLAAVRLLRHAAEHLPIAVVGPGLDESARDLLVDDGASELLDLGLALDATTPLLERTLRWTAERARLERDLERARRVGMHLAHHDTLTDLPNRQLFKSRLRQLIAQAQRGERQLAVLFLDLDRFKHINDTLGHGIGDRLLQEVASRIRSCIRESDLAARRGGDEFNVILADIRRGQDAARVARKIQQALSRPFRIDGRELFVGVSTGISLFPVDGRDVDTLVKHADIAMYQAKGQGGGVYRFFQPTMNERALERLALEQSLRLAVERGEFVLHFQPQVAVASGAIVGMEALVRWEHPDLGLIYPDEFIPVAEETGLIRQLGEHVLQAACREARAWTDAGLGEVTVAVNFSACHFQEAGLARRVREALAEARLPASRLEVEITESAVMGDAAKAMDVMGELRDMGVGIAIDDFGTGHSSLSYLKRFPIDRLKIDKTFVRTLLVDPKDAAITEAIVGMAHSLRMKACAEGVETQRQLEFLRGCGCDDVQGYLLSRPLPADRAQQLLATRPVMLDPARPRS